MRGPCSSGVALRARVRVLIVAPSLRFLGGQAVLARRLLARLRDEEWVSAELLPVDPALPRPLDALQRIKYVRTIVTSIVYVASLFRTVWRADVVHAFSASYWSFLLAPAPAIVIGRLFGKRVLVNYHSGEAGDHLARWGWHAIPLLRLADEIVVPSQYLVDVFRRFGLEATAVPNFLEPGAIDYRRRESIGPRFLSNRNFEAHYNVGDILRAFADIERSYPDAALTIVGDGPLRAELHALAQSLQLRGAEFVGSVKPDEMPAYYDRADIYLNAPLIDNTPISVIEAFAAGVPVVSSDAGGIPYIVQSGENGLLVGAGDAAALATAALRLLSDQALALRLADSARHDATTLYSWPSVREGWRRVYLGAGAA